MYLDDDGNPAGYDVELLNLLATDLGVDLRIENQEFDALIPGLLAGKWDMISVGLVPRPPRLLQMYFTDSYVPYEQVLVAAADTDRDADDRGVQHRRHDDHGAAGLDGCRPGEDAVPRRHARRVPATGRRLPRGGVRATPTPSSSRATSPIGYIAGQPGPAGDRRPGCTAADRVRRLGHPARRRQVPGLPQQLAAVLQEQRHARLASTTRCSAPTRTSASGRVGDHCSAR